MANFPLLFPNRCLEKKPSPTGVAGLQNRLDCARSGYIYQARYAGGCRHEFRKAGKSGGWRFWCQNDTRLREWTRLKHENSPVPPVGARLPFGRRCCNRIRSLSNFLPAPCSGNFRSGIALSNSFALLKDSRPLKRTYLLSFLPPLG